ncbi:SDR family NAD(P)-dependent oxidoreductase [Sinorhizobium meliloti]|uniref:SDR family NAD(P)-dependent oxidoreductase n=1 Tax=Rhizobium meliloti TaxID=382 RepID=UPI0013E3BF56|nr:SDR family NAD(P)-dependent oxidoreductase [Sinorhizobium meliloti]
MGSEIAIIGMAGRFPGATTINELWALILGGTDASVELADWPDAGQAEDPRLVRRAFLLDGYDEFDAAFFRLVTADAELLDPQQRVFLEVAWETFEDAAYVPDVYPGTIGVYAGMGAATYALQAIDRGGSADYGLKVLISNDKDYLSARVAYHLNLKGPCVSVQAACASSLTAVHVAAQALLGFECDMALAGGVSIRLPHRAGYIYHEGGILSTDGRCRAFDASASGTAYGSGAAAVLLKRLEDAVRDRDHIHAVLRGSAVTHDGSLKVGFTAPGVDGQSRAIREALAVANAQPDTIGYVEAHGTGTPIGDPIEIAALKEAFSEAPMELGSCAIGSIKSNIGHLDAAAGAAGLIKACLVVEHGVLPPAANLDTPNPELRLADSPFYLPTREARFRQSGLVRRAAVSSMGMGGTNVHAIVEQYASRPRREGRSDEEQLIVLSARSSEAAAEAGRRLGEALRAAAPPPNLSDVAYTLQVGRKAFAFRRALVCRDIAELLPALDMSAHRQVTQTPPSVRIVLPDDDTVVALCSHPALKDSWLLGARKELEERVSPGRCAADSAGPATLAAYWQLGRFWQSCVAVPVQFRGTGLAALAAESLEGRVEVSVAFDLAAREGVAVAARVADADTPIIEGAGGWARTESPRRAILRAIGDAWETGVEIRWDALLRGAQPHRTRLPTYPFERRRYWIGAATHNQNRQAAAPEAARLRVPVWRRMPPGRPDPTRAPREWLLFGPTLVGERIASSLRDHGASAIVIDDPATADRAVPATEAADLIGLVDLRPLTAPADADAAALLSGAIEMLDRFRDRPGRMRYVVMTSGVFDVTGEEPLRPRAAVLRGLIKVLPQEDARFSASLLDLCPDWPANERALAALLLCEPPPREAALRGRYWFIPGHDVLPVGPAGPTHLRIGGSYVITGGLGQIASVLARHLAQKHQARLTLVGRTVAARDEAIAAIETAGGEAIVVPADVTDAEALRAALDIARQRFGKIDGVIHCAGLPGAGPLQAKSRDGLAAVLAPKVAGAENLLALTHEDDLDFVILFSSMSAHFGGIGQVDYSGANAVLGALAESFARKDGPLVCCLDWDPWHVDSWIGRGLDAMPELRDMLASQRRRTGLAEPEALSLFEQALAAGHPHLLISRRSPEDSLRWHDELVSAGHLGRVLRPGSAQPAVAAAVDAAGLSRARLAQIVAEILEVPEVDEEIVLNEIGLHSLLAIDLTTRLSAEVGYEVPLRWILDFPSVARLAERLEAARNGEIAGDKLESVLVPGSPPKQADRTARPSSSGSHGRPD